MKQFLLTGLFSAAALGMMASPATSMPAPVKMQANVTAKSAKNLKTSAGTKLAPGVTLSKANGIKKIHTIAGVNSFNSRIAAAPAAKAGNAAPDGYVLFESFEDWDGTDYEWTPEGWTVDMRGEVERNNSWTPTAANPMLPLPSDGDYYYGINFSDDLKQDEWLITPEVEVAEGMQLSYWLYLDPAFLFSLDNVDWETYEFIGDKAVAATLQVWAQEEGGEWQMLHDFADDFAEYGLMELLMMSPAGLELKTENLDAFAGKKVKVAFRYVGIGGNTMLIDAVGIGYPALDGISYLEPFSTLYWGFERSVGLMGLTSAIAHQPVYEPLTWTNMSYIEGATFSWDYCDPITAEFVKCDDPELLTVTYVPDYSSAASMKNNFFYPPVLRAEAPHASPGSYSSPYVYFQAGGKPERTLNDGSEFLPSLVQFNFNQLGVSMITVDDEEIGDIAIPVFGHNVNSNQYWLNYSLNGAEEQEGDFSHLEGIANIFFASGAPLVVNGVTAYGFGKVDDDAEFVATIYGLDAEMSADFTTFTEIAKATLKGADFICEDHSSIGYLTLPFDFDQPVVLRATDEHPAYVVMLSGFNSDKVELFVPFQSEDPDPNYMNFGYTLHHIDLSNHIDRDAYYSFKPMVYKEYGEYVDLYGAFAIGLEAEYPWLTTECEGVSFENAKEVKVALGSYYDGSKLSVEAPAGVDATVAGRYDKCELTLSRNDAEVVVEGNVVVKGPGVEVSIPVSDNSLGVSSVGAANADVVGFYDLNGRKVENPDAGIYIVKYSDGSVRKTVVK